MLQPTLTGTGPLLAAVPTNGNSWLILAPRPPLPVVRVCVFDLVASSVDVLTQQPEVLNGQVVNQVVNEHVDEVVNGQ